MEYKELLIDSAKKMVKTGKGILAADESNPTCGKRFDSIGVSPSFETRNDYRDMVMTAGNSAFLISSKAIKASSA